MVYILIPDTIHNQCNRTEKEDYNRREAKDIFQYNWILPIATGEEGLDNLRESFLCQHAICTGGSIGDISIGINGILNGKY
jgi:hypothetical protein